MKYESLNVQEVHDVEPFKRGTSYAASVRRQAQTSFPLQLSDHPGMISHCSLTVAIPNRLGYLKTARFQGSTERLRHFEKRIARVCLDRLPSKGQFFEFVNIFKFFCDFLVFSTHKK